MDAKEYFENKRYVYLNEVISKEDCKSLTQHIFNLKNEGKMEKDDQCPLSWAVYGDSVFDDLLFKIAEPLSNQLGIQLIPTYTYARLYDAKGEVLEWHCDRPSCEISGTLTLGHDPDSAIWPIFFGKDENDKNGTPFEIDVGDMIMYRGNELPHWRQAYKGNWQAQVFFHFVDANGPHKEWAYDKRIKVPAAEPLEKSKEEIKPLPGLTKEQMQVQWRSPANNSMIIQPQADIVPGYSAFNSKFNTELTFTKQECEKIIEYASDKYPTKASVGSEAESQIVSEVREVEQYGIDLEESTRWIFEKISAAVTKANAEYYRFDLIGITHELQLLHYKSDEFQGHYDWHVDHGTGNAATRKLSISIMLSPEDAYEGGDLVVNNNGVIINSCREQGSINMFPSYMLHKVTPVTKGERWVVVSWINGTHRFR